MTLAAGDLTTLARVKVWLPNVSSNSDAILTQLITSMTALIYNKINRSRLYSQTFTRYIDGVGNYQITLPDWPVTNITSVQMGAALINVAPLPDPVTGVIPATSPGYGYRFLSWDGNLPGNPCILEFVNGFWRSGQQNIKVVYTAGYLISDEAWTIPVGATVVVLQPQGLWCRDGGVQYANGTALVAVASNPTVGQYIAPSDSSPGLYTFNAGDIGQDILISYSFVPSDLEEACIQMVAERSSYRSRVGELSHTLGGQETTTFVRGARSRFQRYLDLPPEVEGLIWPYIDVRPPVVGAPV